METVCPSAYVLQVVPSVVYSKVGLVDGEPTGESQKEAPLEGEETFNAKSGIGEGPPLSQTSTSPRKMLNAD